MAKPCFLGCFFLEKQARTAADSEPARQGGCRAGVRALLPLEKQANATGHGVSWLAGWAVSCGHCGARPTRLFIFSPYLRTFLATAYRLCCVHQRSSFNAVA